MVFHQITQISGTFHFPINSNVRVYRSSSSLSAHWVWDIEAPRRNCRLANTRRFLPFSALKEFSVCCLVNDPLQTYWEVVRTRLCHGVAAGLESSGFLYARASELAPQEAEKWGPIKQTDHRQLYPEYQHSGTCEAPFWDSAGSCQYVTFLDNTDYDLSKKESRTRT